MTHNTIQPEIEVSAAVEAAIRATAANAPPLLVDLDGVRARTRTIRRRRRALRAVGAAAVVVAVAVSAALPALWPRPAPDEIVVGGPVGHPIGLWLKRNQPPETGPWAWTSGGGHVPGSSGEIAAQLRTVAGQTAVVPVGTQPGLTDQLRMGPAPLPGGGLATIGIPPPSSNGPAVEFLVVVVDADGRTVSSRPHPPTDAYEPRPMPMTGSRTTLFWWAFRGFSGKTQPLLVTYDIATGRYRELTPAVGGNGYELPYFGMQATSTRIVSWPAMSGPTCSADIADARTGERVTTVRLAVPDCTDVYFALSPDNKRLAALVTYRATGVWIQHVIVADARTGEIQKDFGTPDIAAGVDKTKLVGGIDWADRRTLRYARGVLPPSGTGSDPVLLTFNL